MGVSNGGQMGAVAPLDFHTWYRYILDRGLIVLFFGLFCYFSVFFPLHPSPRKRLNSVFPFFFFVALSGNFSADALDCSHEKLQA